MNTTVTLNMLPDLFACAALMMLSIYHLMIYAGRKQDKNESYNLYFALFVFAATLFIIAPYFQPQYFVFAFKPPWINVINIEVLMMMGLFYSGIKFLNRLLKISQNLKRFFLITYITIPLNFFLSLTSNFISLQFYYKNILPLILFIVITNVILIFFIYALWGYRQKLFSQAFFLVLYVGFVSLTLNILIYRTIELFSIPDILILNHYISVIILFIFTYALSIKFNKEYVELKELKISLEGKVAQRTIDLQQANKMLEERNDEVEKQKQEIVTINQQLSDRAIELANLDEAKSRFFTNISHEFRTPLTLIIGPLESLLINTEDEKLTKEYTMMIRQAKRLLELINQLLEISKLQKGMMVLNVVEDNFNRFIRTIISSYTSLAHERSINLNFAEECHELVFYFDKDKIEKIVTNLLTNAFKFTPEEGRIDVIVSQNIDERSVQVTVLDNGMGIPQDKLKNIFDTFYQVDPAIKHNFDASGIGLALVKELLELHQGSIKVKSDLNSGAEFKFEIPLKLHNYDFETLTNIGIESSTESFVTPTQTQTNHQKTVILLVEDNEDMRYYIRTNLPEEYKVVEALNGQDGFVKSGELVPDLIISDIMMPVLDGLEMTKMIKQDERVSHIPIILLTAKASHDSRIEGLQTQADDYITKPFSIPELTLRIHNLIANRQKLREKFSRSISVNPSEIVTTSMDEKFLLKALLVVEKNLDEPDFNSEMFCEAVGMSRAHVHRKLRALVDQSVTEFIRTIRLKRAAQLLAQKTGSVSEIAYQTGFNNLSYFTKCFKEEFGTLPSEYFATETA